MPSLRRNCCGCPSFENVEPGPEIVLNEEQQTAYEEILERIRGTGLP